MNIVINTCAQGIFSIDLPFMEEYLFKKDSILGFISMLNIHVSGPHPLGKSLAQEMQGYLQGENLQFGDYPVVWHETTTFGKRVLSGLRNIPYGQTMSYSELAELIGFSGASRAVGQALKKNPWPVLFPCHRIIGKNGELKGFSSGSAWKRILLIIEKSIGEVNV